MKTEVSTAANFVTRLLRGTRLLSEEQLQQFRFSLEESLGDHYQHHWFPNAPCRGSGYRCIRINHKMDPIIGRAASTIGLTKERLFSLLPSELTMWVDPFEVSYRIGEDGSICVLYESTPQSDTNPTSVDSCKDELRIGQPSPSKSFGMMTCSS
ncbi:protein BTG1 [Triplophysa rosa]|uniref:B-cell translocation gene 1-like protein n=1 Tax=Triplophysa rosa TaxID=992332 RepID=A0A9W7T398_TRIRA|nr:protein BTG1 [Triplophysa rosa]XP_057181880.1 protein BTG1 [Triplophysa rosa]KAI7790855.1 B-cell translocation gene 1-like protein [Triplophysa rosa]